MRISKYIEEIGLECGIGELNYSAACSKSWKVSVLVSFGGCGKWEIGEEDGCRTNSDIYTCHKIKGAS